MDKSFIQARYATIRLAHRISARKLSLELGQSTEYINQIENGKCLPSLEGLLNFCEYFQMSIGEFFEENFRYPVQYEKIIKELNKMDALTIEKVYEFIQLINR
ncbi:MAG: helix-turn-helix domain-containing protein [Clostridia bacterium]|nr:helix-turn-helix domain-containing protein [Clostridia bacterium]